MTVRDALNQSASELLQRIEAHRCLLAQAVEGESTEFEMDTRGSRCCPHKRTLKETLLVTIEILEQTRSAFRSKRLEALRKELIRVLAEDI